MALPDFSDAALVLLGHGTALNAESSAPVYQHAAALRSRNLFAEVQEAFWKQEPQVTEVLARLTTRRVFIVPVFISEGYFSEEVIPMELGFRTREEAEFCRTQRRGTQTLTYCKPIGTHDSMTEVILARARDIVKQFPFPRAPKTNDTTLFIAGHGTERNENSRKAIERQQDLIRARGLYAAAHAVFMEEEPRMQNLYQLAQTKNVIVVPFFISDGLHVREDIPVLLGEPKSAVEKRLKSDQPTWRNPMERKGKLVWYTESVGTEPGLAEVILERVAEAGSPGFSR
jgi:sirohydrochlorin cobaltochelatase